MPPAKPDCDRGAEGLAAAAELITVRRIDDARRWTRQQQCRRLRVALVPTMGALHEGHLALVRRARQLADVVAVSIFVNPTQFGPQEDFDRYPRTLADDVAQLRREAVALLFAPTPEEMYGSRFSTSICPPDVARPLEGEFRPGHFAGVCTVVTKLFQIIPADVAVFGQKDYQQARVIQEMVRDLNLPIEIDVLPTVREADGMALSSRNRYLSPEQRQRAAQISQALDQVVASYRSGLCDAAALQQQLHQALQSLEPQSIDYAAVVDPQTLRPLAQPLPPFSGNAFSDDAANDPAQPAAAAVAVVALTIGNTRLIDNRLL